MSMVNGETGCMLQVAGYRVSAIALVCWVNRNLNVWL